MCIYIHIHIYRERERAPGLLGLLFEEACPVPVGWAPAVVHCWHERQNPARERRSLLNLSRQSVSCRRPERARNEGSTGPKRPDDTRCNTYKRPSQSWNVRRLAAGRGGFASASQEIGNRKSSIWSTGSSTLLALTTESCTDYEHLGDERDRLRARRRRDRATKSVVECGPSLGWQRRIRRCQP